MKNSALKTVALVSGFMASSAFAQSETGSPTGQSGATFWIDHNVLTWSSDKAKPETGNKVEETALQTTPDDVVIGIFWKNFGLYVQPNNAGGAVGLSLFPQKEIEVGVLLGLDQRDVKDGEERKSHTVGLFGKYYMELDSVSTLEFAAKYWMSQTEIETPNATTGGQDKSDAKSNTFEIGVQYAYQVANHFHVIPGIFFHTGSSEDDPAGVAPKSEEDYSGITLNLAHFRYVF